MLIIDGKPVGYLRFTVLLCCNPLSYTRSEKKSVVYNEVRSIMIFPILSKMYFTTLTKYYLSLSISGLMDELPVGFIFVFAKGRVIPIEALLLFTPS